MAAARFTLSAPRPFIRAATVRERLGRLLTRVARFNISEPRPFIRAATAIRAATVRERFNVPLADARGSVQHIRAATIYPRRDREGAVCAAC